MTGTIGRSLAILLLALLYWGGVCRIADVGEPWDAAGYWSLWYPVSIVLSAAGGAMLARRGWRAGIVVTLAQLPIVVTNGGVDPLLVAGVAMLLALAIPPAVAAAVAGRLAARRRGR